MELGRPPDIHQPIKREYRMGESKVENLEISSDNTAKTEAGRMIKDLKMTTIRRMKMTLTKQMMTKLMKLEVRKMTWSSKH